MYSALPQLTADRDQRNLLSLEEKVTGRNFLEVFTQRNSQYIVDISLILVMETDDIVGSIFTVSTTATRDEAEDSTECTFKEEL